MDKKKTKIIVIIAAVCVAVAVIVGIVFAVRGSTEPDTTAPRSGSVGGQVTVPTESVGEVSTEEPATVPESTEPSTSTDATSGRVTTTKPRVTSPTKVPAATKPPVTNATSPVTITDGKNPFIEYDENGNPVPIGATDFRRSLGYCEAYDKAAPYAAMDFDTVRVKFRYKNLDWMVQMWKGQYGPSIGCEIGVYHKPTTRMIEFYDCATDENSLYMEASLYRKGKFVFRMPYTYYWWAAAFDPGMLDNVSDRSELNVVARITLKDKEMCAAFVNALQKQQDAQGRTFKNVGGSYNKNQPTVTPVFKVAGNDVYFTW